MNALKLFFTGLPIGSIKQYALIGLIIYSVVVTLLWRLEVSSHKLTKSEYETNAKTQEALNAIKLKQRESITNDVVTSYAESVNKLKEYYANNPHTKYRTIRVQDTTTCTMPTENESASRADAGHNGTKETVAERATNEVQIDTLKAGQEIVQCLELIQFEKRQGNVE